MSDYLSNLSARSFDLVGDIEIVSPRLPSLFEPSQEIWSVFSEKPGSSAMRDETDEGESVFTKGKGVQDQTLVNHSQEIQDDGMLTQSKSREAESLKKRGPEFPKTAPAYEVQLTTTMRPPKENSVSPVLFPAKSGTEPNPPEEHAARNFTLDDQLTQKKGTTDRSVSVQERHGAQPLIRTVEEGLVIDNIMIIKVRAETKDGDPVSSADEAVKQNDNISPLMAEPFNVTSEAIHGSYRSISSHEANAKPEPTINVTIGRVEVRTISSSATQKKFPPKNKTMSLDDYLRRRGGGER